VRGLELVGTWELSVLCSSSKEKSLLGVIITAIINQVML
jgi:hypothetical protein